MATGPKIVHKQFNSPIGLYSQSNIQATLNKHIKTLDNGTVGIDFNAPGAEKPANLANSAVLRMLEEEERSRRGYPKLDESQVAAILETLVRQNHRFDGDWPPGGCSGMRPARSWAGQLDSAGHTYASDALRAAKGQRKVVWPPAPETNGYHQPQPQQNQQAPAYYNNQQYQEPQQQQQYQAQHTSPRQYQAGQDSIPIPVQHYNTHQNSQSQPEPHYQSATCEGLRQNKCGLSKLIPTSPGYNAPPAQQQTYRPPAQTQAPANRWAPVAAPLSPQQTYGSQPAYPSQQSPAYQSQHSPAYYPEYAEKPFSPPPATVTLRPQPPVHQQPAPVYVSQPVAASYKGGVNMRGDQKWPPQSVREAVAAENEARRLLAKGPACRPRKVHKDYRPFFAQHALNNNYPGYRAPPGTQHYEDYSGRSSY